VLAQSASSRGHSTPADTRRNMDGGKAIRMNDQSSEAMGRELKETMVGHYFESYQRNFFQDVDPAATLKIEAPLDKTPACLWLPKGEIWINPAMVELSPKTCRIHLLHELIHHKLHFRDGDADAAEGERFQAEVKRLFEAGAYKGLL
jgi:hypothetical protein